jgi:hypothetical protein
MKRTLALSTIFALSLAAAASATTFSVSGPGGLVPDCTYLGGVWNTAPSWSIFTSAVTVPTTVASITQITLTGFGYDTRGEVHVFLTSPTGARYNVIVRPGFDGTNCGDSGFYYFGNYDIVQTGGSSLSQGSTGIYGGTYNQFLNSGAGAWTSSSYPIQNTPLNSITGPAGTWTLSIVDWCYSGVPFLPYDALQGWTLSGVSGGPGVTFCEPGIGSVIACPCGNLPSGLGRGCNNSSGTGGATLIDLGVASVSADTLVFTTSDERPTALSIVLQGHAELSSGTPYGDGVLCLGDSLRRLYVKSASGGSITAPSGSDPSISARSAALGDPILGGSERRYQVYYRDPAAFGCFFSPGAATFNVSVARRLAWNP